MEFEYSNSKAIALVDCNNFYVSCERVFNPSLRAKPVVAVSGKGGCVIARSNEAKAIGIPMGDPIFKSEKILQKYDVKVLYLNLDLYSSFSARLMSILKKYTQALEVYSTDEAFLDFSHVETKSLEAYAQEIKEEVYRRLGLEVTISVAETKTLCKLNSYLQKEVSKNRDGLQYFNSIGVRKSAFNDSLNLYRCMSIFNLSKRERREILKTVPIAEVWGIGKKSQEWLKGLGVFNVAEFCDMDPQVIKQKMTVGGLRIQNELLGISCLDYQESFRPRKSLVSSRSFEKDIVDRVRIEEAVSNHASIISKRLRAQNSLTTSLGVFVRSNPFRKNQDYYANSMVIRLEEPSNSTMSLIKQAKKVLAKIYKSNVAYKKVGVYVESLVAESYNQMDLFEGEKKLEKISKEGSLMKVWDSINDRYGENTLQTLAMSLQKRLPVVQAFRSPNYTSSWKELLVVGD